MTFGQAIAAAMELGGGSVTCGGRCYEVSEDGSTHWIRGNISHGGGDWKAKQFPRETIDFAEAWERLGRGECVVIEGESDSTVAPQLRYETRSSSGYIGVEQLKRKRFYKK